MFTSLVLKELKKKNISVSSLSALLNTSPQNLSQKLKRDNFSEREMKEISKALESPLFISLCESDNIDSLKDDITAVLNRY